jgi:hypothetical protein
MSPYKDFTARLKLLISKNPHLITTTLSNIFTMRLIGNKTHGDLAEIAIAEFINQFMYDFKSVHVGKDLYRAKEREEDIKIINEITKAEFPVSLKAYGDGPLQLSTDKHFQMFPKLKSLGTLIEGKALARVWADPVFAEFGSLNVLPLIYDEKKQRCNILVFDSETARKRVARIALEEAGHGRKHPVFRFHDGDGDYVCEVRYLRRTMCEGDDNILANICMLAAAENNSVSDSDPHVYLPALVDAHKEQADAILGSNFMPSAAVLDYSTAPYAAFTSARSQVLAASIAKLCDGD